MFNTVSVFSCFAGASPVTQKKPVKEALQMPRFSGKVDDFLKKHAATIQQHNQSILNARKVPSMPEQLRLWDAPVVDGVTGQDLYNYLQENTSETKGFVDDNYINQKFGPFAEAVLTALQGMVTAGLVSKGRQEDFYERSHYGVYMALPIK